jgi:subtilisin family serine protease
MQTMKNDIQWVGHMKPEYKTKLNFLSNIALGNTTVIPATHSEAIQLYAILAGEQQDSSLVDRLTNQFQKHQSTIYSTTTGKQQQVNLVNAKLVSPRKMLIRVSPDVSHQVLEHLKKQEEIHWIEVKLPMGLLNGAGNELLQGYGVPIATGQDKRPLWSRGITGKGEIVGVGDTGIDYDNCFFRDPNQQVSFDNVNPRHRKIYGYQTVQVLDTDTRTYKTSDRQDVVNGHGTHVAGSIAGSLPVNRSTEDGLYRFGGVARDAKLFFTDIYSSVYPGELLIPDDLYTNYFPIPYENGARVHSNSWGCSFSIFQCTYDCVCYWTQDTKYGKKGAQVSNQFCKDNIGTDCCKLCNNYDSRASEIDQFVHEHDEMLIVYAAGNIGYISKDGTIGSPSTSKNVLAVGASHTTNDNFLDTVDYEDFSNAFAAFGLSSTDQCCTARGKTDEETRIIRRSCCPSTIKEVYADQKSYFNSENLAYFSSRGPTFDGRIKPDVVAPGYAVVSMHSDGDPTTNQCGTQRPAGGNSAALYTQRGTSMATPLVSGAAALVRQYLKENNFTHPSGPLVKAVLIHSAKQLSGIINLDGRGTSMNVPQKPNQFTGFGLVSLQRALAFADSKFKFFAHERKSISNADRHVYCFRTTKDNTAFRATFAYYDPPASSAAADLLVNNLDLDMYYYQEESKKSTRVPGNDNSEGDELNTVEQVSTTDIPAGYIIAVTVTGTRVSVSQNYAVVMTGDVELLDTCWVPPTGMNRKTLLYIIVGACAAIAGIIIVGALGAAVYFKMKDRKKEHEKTHGRRLGSSGSIQQTEEVRDDENPSQYYRPNQLLD